MKTNISPTPPSKTPQRGSKTLRAVLTNNEAPETPNAPEAVLSGSVKTGQTLEGVVISPLGEWPHGKIVQIVTPEACRALAAAADGEILVDFDHDAEEGRSTAAAAWIKNLRFEEGRGLVGDFTFTDVGAQAVASRRFRFLSPCWEVEELSKGADSAAQSPRVAPVRLLSVALTNKPNIPMGPVLNSQSSVAAAPSAAINPNPNPKKENRMDPTKIIEALGLKPEATEEEILSAIGALKAEVEAAAAAKADAEAEEFAEANKAKCNKAVLKAQFLANREVAKAIVEAIAAPAAVVPRAPVCNRAEAKTPPAAPADPMKGLANCKSASERVAYVTAHAAEFNK